MQAQPTPASYIGYLLDLAQAGWAGAASARKDLPAAWKAMVWAPAAIGAVAGASAASLNRNRRSGYGALVGGLVGTVVGLGCAMALASRGATSTVAQGAMKKMGAVSDARWLERHPIDYA